MPFLYLVLGLAALYWGAEWLVRGASRIAFSLHVSSLAIGLTVVAFGTSMPEMVAGGVAAWRGNTDIVLGNVFGSNIANVGLILAVAALLRRIPVSLRSSPRWFCWRSTSRRCARTDWVRPRWRSPARW